ncbi:hypothetical protein [Botryobacter ruber]|uniref:hypothetical protein n=1 Tax=Botryobacter ruber TaxID=2171629 RepID=UPI000FEC87C2|nr:hypothetical protein [Botryobacter ruber]
MGIKKSEPEEKPSLHRDQEEAGKAPVQAVPEQQPPFPEAPPERPEQEPHVPPEERTKGIP